MSLASEGVGNRSSPTTSHYVSQRACGHSLSLSLWCGCARPIHSWYAFPTHSTVAFDTGIAKYVAISTDTALSTQDESAAHAVGALTSISGISGDKGAAYLASQGGAATSTAPARYSCLAI